MKKNNSYILIIILLIILAIIQLTYRHKIQTKKDNRITNEMLQISTSTDGIVIENIDESLNDYNGVLNKDMIIDSINKLITITVPEIKNATKEKNIMEDEDYYNNNKNEIEKNGIITLESFIDISQEIKNYSNNEALVFKKAKLNKEEEIENGKYKLYLDLEYDRNITLHFICFLSVDTNEIIYSSNSEVEKLFSNYSGKVTKTDFYNVVNGLKNNAKWIHDNTKLMSINSQRQFFDDNKEKLKEMGINSVDDFINISMQISNNVEWDNSTKTSYYKIDLNSFEKRDDYDIVKMSFIYGYMDELMLELDISSNENVQPAIKITGEGIDN